MTAQIENGYTKIANELYEDLLLQIVTGSELKVILLVMRKTYGWGMTEAEISLSYISLKTNMCIRNASKVKKLLLSRNILIKNGRKLKFNKYFNTWKNPAQTARPAHRASADLPTGAVPPLPTETGQTLPTEPDSKESIKESLKKVLNIVEFLNNRLKTKFSHKNEKTRKRIIARLNEGFTVEDICRVIDCKSKQWETDVKMRKYLRPETLFGSKFEGYLMESRIKIKSGIQQWAEKHGVRMTEPHSESISLQIGG